MATRKYDITELVKELKIKKLFNYTGSKEKFFDNFKEMFEKNGCEKIEVGTYIEGFTGSLASLLINLQFINPKKVVLNDLNKRLINLYKQIKENPEYVFEGYKMIEEKFKSFIPVSSPKVRVFPSEKRDEIRNCETLYKYIRTEVNKKEELDWLHASCFLFIMNHQFKGMYNENKSGDFNIAFNWSTLDVNIEEIKENIFKLNKLFNSEVEFVFETLDIDTLISKYNDHDTFIYLDPPYINTDVQYNKKRLKKENCFTKLETHTKLLDSCSKYKYVMYSNNDHKEFQKYFNSYVNFNRKSSVSPKKSNKSKKEILGLNINTPVNNVDYTVEDKEYSISIGTAFSGMGCPEYALKKLGVNHTSEFVIDWNKWCRETLIKNHKPKQVFSDITKIQSNKLYPCSLYVWGSPCQDVSQSNKIRLGLKGEKSKLFFEGYRVLKDLQPKYSIFENVQGLLSSNGGEDFKTVLKLFEDLGTYNIYWKKINPVDIGGNTTRVRVFVVLIRKDINITFNFPKNVKSTKCIKDCLIEGDYKYIDNSQLIPWERPIEKQRGKLRKDFVWTGTKRIEQSRVFNINYPSPTIQRSGHVLVNDTKGVRLLSPMELKKIQGFEEDMDLSHLSNTQIKSQLGNTMEVETMKKLLGEIVRIDKLHLQEVKSDILAS